MLAALSLCLPPALLRDRAVVDVCHCVATLLQTTPCIPPATTLGLSGTLSRGRRHAVATRKRCPLRPRCGEPRGWLPEPPASDSVDVRVGPGGDIDETHQQKGSACGWEAELCIRTSSSSSGRSLDPIPIMSGRPARTPPRYPLILLSPPA
ncbi:hypothetical protein OH76DRAFT_431559 [Lentinus brumalis]|uniref:Secreted protein n=1 Tax=Lentinus brumalis TaxID=2498619 RepID=A0A371DDK0_9APHY|nr:hypothetical protein OH76DRAFT_431559 [Polyporus brumalis]